MERKIGRFQRNFPQSVSVDFFWGLGNLWFGIQQREGNLSLYGFTQGHGFFISQETPKIVSVTIGIYSCTLESSLLVRHKPYVSLDVACVNTCILSSFLTMKICQSLLIYTISVSGMSLTAIMVIRYE